MESTSVTTPTASTTPVEREPVTDTVVNQTGQTVVPGNAQELSGGAQAGISAAIGVGNLCCGPMCYGCSTVASTTIGIVLYFAWRKDKPKTAKTILTVTLITGGIALVLTGILFAIGLAGSIIDNANF